MTIRSRASPICSARRRVDHRLAVDVAEFTRLRAPRVVVEHRGQQFLVEAAPIGANAHWFAMLARGFDHKCKLFVALFAAANIAWVDAVFVQQLRALGVFREQAVAVEMEVPDQRHMAVHGLQSFFNTWNRGSGGFIVDRDAHQLGPGPGELGDLPCGADSVAGIGVGHRLHNHRAAAADCHVAHLDRYPGSMNHCVFQSSKKRYSSRRCVPSAQLSIRIDCHDHTHT